MSHYDTYHHLQVQISHLRETVKHDVQMCVARLTDRELVDLKIEDGCLVFYLDGLILAETQRELETAVKRATGFQCLSIHVYPDKVGQIKVGADVSAQ